MLARTRDGSSDGESGERRRGAACPSSSLDTDPSIMVPMALRGGSNVP
jgi:hypothetical protein